MIRAVSVLLLLPLAACGTAEPDVAACETFVQGRMLSPTSYQRVAMERVDGEQMPAASFPKATGMVRPRKDDPDRELWDIKQAIYSGSQLALRQLVLEYDSANEYGTPVREKAVCGFRLVNGELEGAEELDRRARRAASGDPIDMLDTLRGRQQRDRPRFDCCL